MNHQVVFAGRNRLRVEFSDHFFSRLPGFLQPGICFKILVADALRAGQAAARLKIARAAVDGRHGERRLGPDNILFDARAVGGGIELLLILKADRGIHKAYTLGHHRCFVQFQQEPDFVVDRNVERVLFASALPTGFDAGRRRHLDRFALIK